MFFSFLFFSFLFFSDYNNFIIFLIRKKEKKLVFPGKILLFESLQKLEQFNPPNGDCFL